MLHETGKPGAGHVQGRTRALLFGTVFAEALALARVHVPVLSVFAIAVHGEKYSVLWGKRNVLNYDLIFFAPVTKTQHYREAGRQTPQFGLSGINRKGLTGGPEASASDTAGTRLCFKYICTTESAKIVRQLQTVRIATAVNSI